MLSDNELLSRLSKLSASQASAESEIIGYLIEVERRRLHLKKAYRSFFEFVRAHLKCSDAAAGRRVAAARVAAKFPIVLEYVRTQKITITSIAMVSSHLTPDNHKQLLTKMEGLSTRSVEKLLAKLSPTKSKRDMIRPILEISQIHSGAESEYEKHGETRFEGGPLILGDTATTTLSEEKSDQHEGCTHEARVRIAFDAPSALAEKLERIKEIHAHKFRNGTLAEIIDFAVEITLNRTAPERRSAVTHKPRETTPTGLERRRPLASLQRTVWKRDQGQCTFTDTSGRRCTARARLQFDHIQPWALGGSSQDAGNLRLLCRAHNLLMAKQYFPNQVHPHSRSLPN